MNVLGIISHELNDNLNIPYEFMEWTGDVQYPYWVGEWTGSPIHAEDGSEESTILLTGTTKGTWSELMETKNTIQKHFHPISGLHMATDDGAVAIYYSHSFPVPTGEADLKRIQINLTVKEWRNIQ